MGIMNDRLRILLGLLLLVVGFLYPKFKVDTVPDKFQKPQENIVALVDRLPEIPDPIDANKLSAVFFAMSEGVKDTGIKTNLQVQYFLDYVGKNTLGNELVSETGEKKYPTFSPVAAKLIEETIGPQNETDPMMGDEKENLSKLFYGFAWKLYDKEQDTVFESYKNKAQAAIAEYNNDEDTPSPDPVVKECICEGKGFVVHGDGHKTDCPCVESGDECKHDPKCGSSKGEMPPEPEPKPEEPKPVQNTSDKKHRGLLRWRK